uniref:Uncharacterized protein n=1 Tax=Rubinisphaera brasiliensis (strain ATCC 49424 / DSM 5305 / JCM 21570 / IAM 15109 / NBRC 103401 / IFAM 1448) TaxID=756272 RepID=F0SNT4_RUBBR|nr:hypothetical protein Plabr_1358 [Rubinisphaera brasiliensis DSM 5305]
MCLPLDAQGAFIEATPCVGAIPLTLTHKDGPYIHVRMAQP